MKTNGLFDTKRLTFSTLGCPNLDFDEILALTKRHGYGGFELRGIRNSIDIDTIPQLQKENIESTSQKLAAASLKIFVLGCSASFHGGKRKAIDECAFALDIARELDIPFIRVFGNENPDDEAYRNVISGLKEVCRLAEGTGVKVLLEAHGDFSTAELIESVLSDVNSPALGLLWDVCHTYNSGEDPAGFAERFAKEIYHVHIKDELSDKTLCLPGKGCLDIRGAVEALNAHGYTGMFSLEWEKRWHCELEDIEQALTAFEAVLLGSIS